MEINFGWHKTKIHKNIMLCSAQSYTDTNTNRNHPQWFFLAGNFFFTFFISCFFGHNPLKITQIKVLLYFAINFKLLQHHFCYCLFEISYCSAVVDKNLHGLLFSIAHEKKGRHKNVAEENARVGKWKSGRTNEHGNKMVDGKLCDFAVIFIMRVIEKYI